MSGCARAGQTIRFGVFEVDLSAGELRKRGLKIKLGKQLFRILASLLRNPGEVVTRQELCRTLWRSGAPASFDSSLKTGINKLREALGDSAANPRFIGTLSGCGYRFIAPVGNLGELILPRPDTSPGRIRVAVLPFETSSADCRLESFSNGITEELIGQLGRRYGKQLAVIARTSVAKYKHSHADMDQVARELRVEYIVEGSVRRAAEYVRVNAQLMEIKNETYLWTESYEGAFTEILNAPSRVAERIARSIAGRLLGSRSFPPQA
jgi:TolB-like protein